jgi:hypothetical protein
MGPVFVVINTSILGIALHSLKAAIGKVSGLVMALHCTMLGSYFLSLLFSLGAYFSEKLVVFSSFYLVADFVSMICFAVILKMVNANSADDF